EAGAEGPAMASLAGLLRGREPIGHGAGLDIGFLATAGIWPAGTQIIDPLDLARILLPASPSHSLSSLAVELGLEQPRPHRAFDDADATRQLFLQLREVAGSLDESLKEAMLALVAPHGWPVAPFVAEALTAPTAAEPRLRDGRRARPAVTR